MLCVLAGVGLLRKLCDHPECYSRCPGSYSDEVETLGGLPLPPPSALCLLCCGNSFVLPECLSSVHAFSYASCLRVSCLVYNMSQILYTYFVYLSLVPGILYLKPISVCTHTGEWCVDECVTSQYSCDTMCHHSHTWGVSQTPQTSPVSRHTTTTVDPRACDLTHTSSACQ